MPELTIRALSGTADLTTFNQLHYTLDDEYERDLAQGRRRPGWMWLALRGERLVARAAWWARAHAATPLLMDVLDLDPGVTDGRDVAQRLVRTALEAMGRAEDPPEYCRFTAPDWRDQAEEAAAVADRAAVLEALGGRLLVERVRLQWEPAAGAPTSAGRLRFRAPADREELLGLLTGVLEGTLDAHSRSELAAATAHEVATAQLEEELPGYRGPREWWTVGTLPGGEPVGFVIPSANDYGPILAYIGVLPAHRGRGYVDELLIEGTRRLAEGGAQRVRASTDMANVPMQRAFHRCGYLTYGGELDYSFSSGA